MNSPRATRPGRPAPWLYLFGAIAWTWAFLGLAALAGQALFEFPTVILYALGGFGPSIVAGLLIAAGRWDPTLDRTALDFFRRAFAPRALSWRWYLGIFGLVLIVALVPVLLDPASRQAQGLIEAGPALFLLIGFIAGAVEEPGWRGYAQEALQRRMPVILASLIVGVFWAAWHLPLFLISGTYQAELGLGTPAFWAFNLAILAGCPLYAWLYNATGGAILATVLYHGLGNIVRELVPDVSNVAEVGVEAAVALIVTIAAWGWMRRRRERGQHPTAYWR
ncbi:MAG: CPBP family intramembrane glutamic endopeptidase [Anaerolineae bacterium]